MAVTADDAIAEDAPPTALDGDSSAAPVGAGGALTRRKRKRADADKPGETPLTTLRKSSLLLSSKSASDDGPAAAEPAGRAMDCAYCDRSWLALSEDG
jgi:hypothetical protein